MNPSLIFAVEFWNNLKSSVTNSHTIKRTVLHWWSPRSHSKVMSQSDHSGGTQAVTLPSPETLPAYQSTHSRQLQWAEGSPLNSLHIPHSGRPAFLTGSNPDFPKQSLRPLPPLSNLLMVQQQNRNLKLMPPERDPEQRNSWAFTSSQSVCVKVCDLPAESSTLAVSPRVTWLVTCHRSLGLLEF